MVLINKLVLQFDGSKLISNNNMYIPTAGKKKKGNSRRSAFLRKSPYLSKFQEDFKQQVEDAGYDEILKDFLENQLSDPYSAIKLTHYVGIPRDELYYKRPSRDDYIRPNDVSNYIKCAEDALSQYIKDDKYNFEVHAVKYLTPRDRWEFVMVVEVIDDYRVYTDELILDRLGLEKLDRIEELNGKGSDNDGKDGA